MQRLSHTWVTYMYDCRCWPKDIHQQAISLEHSIEAPLKVIATGNFADWAAARGWAIRAWAKQADDMARDSDKLRKVLNKVFCYDMTIQISRSADF